MPIRLLSIATLCALWLGSLPISARAADRLILRNLDFILDRTVAAMDEDGVRLDVPLPTGKDRLTWDEIERGTVALDQARFDQLLTELGGPLYRIRQRLKTGDYEGLAEPAEAVYPRYADRKSPTAYMVCQALAWSRLASGHREAAVDPQLRAYELLRSGVTKAASIPGSRRPQFDAKTALFSELPLVWFDADAAKAALPNVQLAIRNMAQPRPEGVYLYYASLAIAANDSAAADRVMGSIRGTEKLAAHWRTIMLAQKELAAGSAGPQVEALQIELAGLPSSCRPAALYALGLARIAASDEPTIQDGVLYLLTLPAEFGRQDPELAAAGLYHAAAALDKLKDSRGAAAVRQELKAHYAGTWFGGKSKP